MRTLLPVLVLWCRSPRLQYPAERCQYMSLCMCWVLLKRVLFLHLCGSLKFWTLCFQKISFSLFNDCQPLNHFPLGWLQSFHDTGLQNHKKLALQIQLQPERRKVNKMETCSQSEKLLSKENPELIHLGKEGVYLKYCEKMEQQFPENKMKLMCILLCVSFL